VNTNSTVSREDEEPRRVDRTKYVRQDQTQKKFFMLKTMLQKGQWAVSKLMNFFKQTFVQNKYMNTVQNRRKID
jgi:hypothetical protein